MRAFALLILVAAILTSCNKRRAAASSLPPATASPNTLISGAFIDKPGLYHFADKKDCYELELSFRGTELRWSSSYSPVGPDGRIQGTGSAGSGMRLKATTDPWFVFVESPGKYWICDASHQLEYDLREGSTGTGGPAVSRGEFVDGSPRPPEDVIARLPANLKKLYPPREARPGI